jgi:hypothetical protein
MPVPTQVTAVANDSQTFAKGPLPLLITGLNFFMRSARMS